MYRKRFNLYVPGFQFTVKPFLFPKLDVEMSILINPSMRTGVIIHPQLRCRRRNFREGALNLRYLFCF